MCTSLSLTLLAVLVNTFAYHKQTNTAGKTLAQLYVDDSCNLWIERWDPTTSSDQIQWAAGCSSFDGWRCAQDVGECATVEQCELGLDLRCSTLSHKCRAPGHDDWCVACDVGQGGCHSSAQCLPGLRCVNDGANQRRCVADGHEAFCSEEKCALGQGNCESKDQCLSGLVCASAGGPVSARVATCARPVPTTRPSFGPTALTASPTAGPSRVPIRAPTHTVSVQCSRSHKLNCLLSCNQSINQYKSLSIPSPSLLGSAAVDSCCPRVGILHSPCDNECVCVCI
jgi:hypothetical protein